MDPTAAEPLFPAESGVSAMAPAESAGAVDRSRMVDRIAIAIALAIFTGLFYVPVLDAAFLNWDDPAYVTGNRSIGSLSWQTVVWAFTTFQEGIWHPLTWLSLALDYRLYGMSARGFHLTNLLLHVANTVLVFLIWARLTGALWRSAVVAALFGLHPMHVESVAWVTERKDVLSTFFWLVTIAAYVRYARLGSTTSYLAVVLAYLLGLASKPMLVTLPFVLLLLDYWPLRRLSRRALLEKIPLLVAAGLVTLVSIAAVRGVATQAIPDPIPPLARVANAIVSCVEYVGLTVWPVHLSPWYSHPWFEGPPLSAVTVTTATVVLVAVSMLVVRLADRVPYGAVGWFWYLGTLVPVLGLVYNGRQGMADRYAYIPHIGLFVAVTWAVADVARMEVRGVVARRIGVLAMAVLLIALGVLTARQTRVWRDDRTFWAYTARTNQYSFIAHQALASIRSSEGRTTEAIALYRRAAYLRPELPRVHVALARLFARTRRPGPAAARYRKAIALEDSAESRFALAQVLLTQRRRASARRELERALVLRPDYPEARESLATIAGASGTP